MKRIILGLLIALWFCSGVFAKSYIIDYNGKSNGESVPEWVKAMSVGKYFALPEMLSINENKRQTFASMLVTDSFDNVAELDDKAVSDIKQKINNFIGANYLESKTVTDISGNMFSTVNTTTQNIDFFEPENLPEYSTLKKEADCWVIISVKDKKDSEVSKYVTYYYVYSIETAELNKYLVANSFKTMKRNLAHSATVNMKKTDVGLEVSREYK